MKQLLLHIRFLLVLMIVVAFSYNTEAVWAQTVPTSTENAQDSTRPTEDSASNDEDSNTGTPDNDADNNPEPTISPVPTNSPEPTPDIPSPSPDPLPEPSPDVTPEPTVTPTPTESPEPTPDPSVTPQPSPEPTISPAPSPEPTVTPTPTGSPEPTPDPSVTPQPSPEPNDDDNQQPEEESPEQSSAPIDQSGEDPPIDGTGGSPSDQNSGGAVDETSTAAEPSGISLPDLSSISDLLDPQNLSNLNPFRSQSSEEENDGKPARPKQLSLPSALSLQPELAEAYEVPDWADQPPAVFVLGSICCFSAGGWLLKSQNLISLLSGLRL